MEQIVNISQTIYKIMDEKLDSKSVAKVSCKKDQSRVFNENTVENMIIDRIFSKITPSDEMFLATCLRLCGHLPDMESNVIARQSNTNSNNTNSNNTNCTADNKLVCTSAVKQCGATYVVWQSENEVVGDGKHPKAFSSLTEDMVLDARIYNHPQLCHSGAGCVKHNTKMYQTIKNRTQLTNYQHSALFLRKIMVDDANQQKQLYEDWKRLIWSPFITMYSSTPLSGEVEKNEDLKEEKDVSVLYSGKKRKLDECQSDQSSSS